ncbi:MAG: hypothetical protein JXA82_12270 [Sedimentisphaerales bacterium]|nr:hypothetical protein [Sedimentisphaerales bacterium]
MRTRRNKGFILFIVVAILPLMALAIIVLLTMERTMAHESTTALLEARARNLIASASAWLLHNAPTSEDLHVLEQTSLSDLCIPNGHLQIEVADTSSDSKSFRIIVECSKGKMTVRRTTILTFPPDENTGLKPAATQPGKT